MRTACVAACAATAVAFALLGMSGGQDPVAMPTAPRLVAAVAAAATAVLVLLPPGERGGLRAGAVLGAAAVMLSGSLLAIPHTVLMVIVRVSQQFTGGSGPFAVEPSWSATLVHGLNVVATALVALWLVVDHRRRNDRCLRCGRISATPPPAGSRGRLWWPALVAVAGALPYGLLKLAWSLGSGVGLTGDGFAQVTAASPGFGDTVVLTGFSIVVCLVMGAGLGKGVVRWALTAVGAGGALMLLPVGLTAAAQFVTVLWGGASIDDSEIAPWAFGLVYGSFLVWGVAFAWLTVAYWRATRPYCRAHSTESAVW
ncbi:hypothetical protein [Nocardiopsis kunsanensis]|uniref:hypothetical protein n=1 Tax=Nocardiopsis kunsanensis TaxID=141693 RepID=UPI00126865C3|nr:hypothetical protein [Nocardiopsis kunsanensis]